MLFSLEASLVEELDFAGLMFHRQVYLNLSST